MKNLYLKFFLVIIIAGTFTSCLEARRASTCPSHDPNYFRTYPYTRAKKLRLLAENENAARAKIIYNIL